MLTYEDMSSLHFSSLHVNGMLPYKDFTIMTGLQKHRNLRESKRGMGHQGLFPATL